MKLRIFAMEKRGCYLFFSFSPWGLYLKGNSYIIGDTRIFHSTIIMGGKVQVSKQTMFGSWFLQLEYHLPHRSLGFSFKSPKLEIERIFLWRYPCSMIVGGGIDTYIMLCIYNVPTCKYLDTYCLLHMRIFLIWDLRWSKFFRHLTYLDSPQKTALHFFEAGDTNSQGAHHF